MSEEIREKLRQVAAERADLQAEMQALLTAKDAERDDLIREAKTAKVKVEEIAEDAKLSVPRIYQILSRP